MGDIVETELKTKSFGRISAQTAKQVIIQGIREAERDRQLRAYEDKRAEIISATVERVDPVSGNVVINTGTGFATLLKNEQIPGESFYVGQHVKVYVMEVRRETRGPLAVSYTHLDVYKRQDTHCIRLSGRMGFCNSKDPVKVEFALKDLIPPAEQSDFCHRLVWFGREVCRAQNPACDDCPFPCKRVKKVLKNTQKTAKKETNQTKAVSYTHLQWRGTDQRQWGLGHCTPHGVGTARHGRDAVFGH